MTNISKKNMKLFSEVNTFRLNPVSGPALRVSVTEAIAPVEALFAPTDPVALRCALPLHLLVLRAEGVAVQTPRQVVPQLRVVAASARRALGGCGGGAVRDHVHARWTHVTHDGLPGERVLALVGGNGFHRRGVAEDTRKQEQRR